MMMISCHEHVGNGMLFGGIGCNVLLIRLQYRRHYPVPMAEHNQPMRSCSLLPASNP
jgi:hypothetical protein